MIILAIESSCDETAAAILEGPDFDTKISQSTLKASESSLRLLSNIVVSQIDIFKAYGGVIPEVAARSHLEAIMPVVHQAILEAEKNNEQFRIQNRALEQTPGKSNQVPPLYGIDAIAVTHTPGLLGSLLVGTLTARTLAILHDKPLYAVHHLKSHIYANWLSNNTPSFPLLALVISGGHTQIIRMTAHNHFEIIGTTYDDAVGECFDKVAKILGLPYPGGPSISKAALGKITKADTGQTIKTAHGDRHAFIFPHPHLDNPLDFSYSGLKTAFLRTVQKLVGIPISHPSSDLKNLLTDQQIADLAASFEQTAVDILIEKMQTALKMYPDTKSIVLAGGVSANSLLREEAAKKLPNCFFPEPKFSGDNAAMVAAAAYFEIQSGVKPTDPYSLNILPRSAIN